MTRIGVDPGNGRLKWACPDATGEPQLMQNQVGESCTPSVAYFPSGGTPIIGTEAANMALAEPERTVTNWKRSMGTSQVLFRDDDGTEYRAKDILTLFLEHIKQSATTKLGQNVRECVICVPANYNDVQKQETKDAAARAGLDVLLLVPEPTAAALGNGLHKLGDCSSLVYDLGCGTFDVTILRNRGNLTEVLATNGEPHLGGQDFNDRFREKIVDMFDQEHGYRPQPDKDVLFYQDVSDRIESSKISLTAKEQISFVVGCDGMLINRPVLRSDFESWTADLIEKSIERTLKTVSECGLSPDEIDCVYAVGGSSLMPMVGVALKETLGKEPVRHCEPHYAAACGAVVAARIECQRQNKPFTNPNGTTLPPPSRVFRDILSHPLGVCILTDDQKLVCHEILPKGTNIPSLQVHTFKLCAPNQTGVLIEILQGKEGQARDNAVLLGHFQLDHLPPQPDVSERIEVKFNLDSSGLLTAVARDLVSGRTAQMEIDYKNGNEK